MTKEEMEMKERQKIEEEKNRQKKLLEEIKKDVDTAKN